MLGTGHIGIILIILSVTLFSTMTVFAQNQLIFIETSQNTYEEGDAIVVSGTVTSIIVGEQVSITIYLEGNLVDIAQVGVAQDGTFVQTFTTKGSQWQKSGSYIVRALYDKTTVETSFYFYYHNQQETNFGVVDPTTSPVLKPEVEPDDKITICHYPPGNMDNPQTLTISENAWKAHDKHGDVFGNCPDKSEEKQFLASAEPVSPKVTPTDTPTQTSQDDDKL